MFLTKLLADLPDKPRFNFFTFEDVNPVSGRVKQRTVAAPNIAMKLLQRGFIPHLRSSANREVRERILKYATSSNPGDSPLQNVQKHRRSRYFYLIDFSNAYRSVDVGKLASVLLQLNNFKAITTDQLTTFLATYFFDERWGLVPGGPASQDLFNLYAGALVDLPIGSIVEEQKVVFTRYIDDLTFSSMEPIPDQVRRDVRDPILRTGFQINHRKCERIDNRKTTVIVTGIGIANGGRLFIPRPYVRKLRGLIHRARTKGGVDIRVIAGMMQILHQVAQTQRMNILEQRVFREFHALSPPKR